MKEGEGISRKTYEGPMDTDNGVRADYGSGGRAGWRGTREEKLGQL